MSLPEAFIEDLKPYMPASEMEEFIQALSQTEASVCIRTNQLKHPTVVGNVPWCPEGNYLTERPVFTLDPLLHAGAYYVQEAASQFVTHVLRSLLPQDKAVTMIDLCAAPGGKSTAALSVLPEGSLLVSNEIDRRRSRILSENITKWGMKDVIVTGNAPADFTGLNHLFDVILADVPCSGEGMFRKDEGAIADWSPAKVEGCVALQRQILSDVWPTLKPGGLLIYSTCTFNVHEDEEQLQYICQQLGATLVDIPTDESWNIHPPLIKGLPCYRFMPHYTRGEGLFMAALRKKDDDEVITPQHEAKKGGKKSKTVGRTISHNTGKSAPKNNGKPVIDLKKTTIFVKDWVSCEGFVEATPEGTLRFIPSALQGLHELLSDHGLYMLQSGIELGTIKGHDIIPSHALAMSLDRNPDAFPRVEIDLENALQYLRREAIVLPPEAPQGYVLVTYQHLPLGFVKNMGNRSNNLYPQEWRIRTL